MSNVGFTTATLISVTAGLAAAYFVDSQNKNINPVIKFFVIPLLVAFVFLKIVTTVFPHINIFGKKMQQFIEDKTLGEINSTGYMEIYPTIFAVFLIFIILLYNGNLN
jgi:mannose/fructose/N-acetylgalactosamine-specific phosphotransferase system component IIC